jgi:transposase
MAKGFRPVLRDQAFLLPPDMRDWLPEDHLVWFVLDTIDVLDVTEFERCRRRGGAGAAGYDPRMLLGLLIYGYCHGVRSSRQFERLCRTDVAFRVLCAQDIPDHATIARFRAECQDAFIGLFAQMTATLPDVAAKNRQAEQSAEQQAAAELVRMANEQGLSLTGPDGLLKQLTKTVPESALAEEMTEHLGRTKLTGAGRPGLRLAAWRAVWGAVKANPVYAARYRHLTSRENNKLTVPQAQAVIAAAILRHLHAVITTGQAWNPTIATHGTEHAEQDTIAA